MSTAPPFRRPRSSPPSRPPCCSPAASPAKARPPQPSPTDRIGRRGRRWSADDAQHRLRHVQPAEPGHQGPGLARGGPGRRVTVTWIQSAGSNKANEALRAGAIDVGSTAGSAALLARSNGSPIKTIDIYSQPEWAAIVVPAGSDDHRRSRTWRASRSPRPRAPTPTSSCCSRSRRPGSRSRRRGAEPPARGRQGRPGERLGRRVVGLDPLMAASEATAGSTLLYRNVDFNTYGFLNATETFLAEKPRPRAAGGRRLREGPRMGAGEPRGDRRDPRRGRRDRPRRRDEGHHRAHQPRRRPRARRGAARGARGGRPDLRRTGDVASQEHVDEALDSLLDDTFAKKADPARLGRSTSRRLAHGLDAPPGVGRPRVTAPVTHRRRSVVAVTGPLGSSTVDRRAASDPLRPTDGSGPASGRRRLVDRRWLRIVGGAIIPVALLVALAAGVDERARRAVPSSRRPSWSGSPRSTSPSADCSACTSRSRRSACSSASRSARRSASRSARSSGSRSSATSCSRRRSAPSARCRRWRGCRC